MKRTALTIAALLLLCQGAAAGWYRVANYQGAVGPNVVQLSLQTYDFGSGITVEGSYFFEGENKPVVVYGQDRDGTIELCEIADDAEFESKLVQGSTTPFDIAGCPIVLEVEDDKITGFWDIGGENHAVILREVGSLDDTDAGEITGTVAIPFWDYTTSHRFSGVYARNSDGFICMERLQVINRTTSQVDQEIVFDDDELCSAGTVMTQIYRNVETYGEAGAETVSVNFSDGRAGYAVDYLVDPVTGLLSPAQ